MEKSGLETTTFRDKQGYSRRSAWKKGYSKIFRNPWDSLYFGLVEKSLANKLTDGDIGAVLRCVNAKEKMTHLCITNCTNITGSGLMPIRGSVKLEGIKLHPSGPAIKPGTKLCESIVMSFLDSIMDNDHDDFKLSSCAVPGWPGVHESVHFKQFARRYNRLFHRNRLSPYLPSDYETQSSLRSSSSSSGSEDSDLEENEVVAKMAARKK